ncbi:M56 family metallopeptidase [Robertkochia sediminum]|uniref:M56 family metallopeptidase n=1 Tax=Robertkochia sediminum TaxID=2785326 RepID=UPI0019329A29|nr:M56 family metallopeptidase [Robertkochia sediminum]MBL7472118.1 TonB-dependent receptor plug domain-containing protein [Robertkochia sediminum]
MMYDAFFTYIIKASALLFLFWVVYKTVLTRETFFTHNRRFLILGALTALALPFWVIEKVEIIQVALTQTTDTGVPPPPPVTQDPAVTLEGMLFYIYIGGVLLFSLKLLIQFASLYRLISKATQRRTYKGLHLVFSNEVKAPFSFFNYIVLPQALRNEDDASVILAHEGVHVKQHHSLDIVFMHLLTIFMWINPIAWLYRKDVAQNLEYLADREVSNKNVSTRKYQYILLKQHLSPQQLSIINPFINSLIKKRIVMLHQQPSNPTKLWKFGIAVPALIVFVLLFNVKTVAQYQITEAVNRPNAMAEQTAALPQEKIEFTINKDMTNEQLEAVRSAVAAKGGTLKWQKLKRDKAGMITKINVYFSYNNNSAGGVYENQEGIADIYMLASGDGSVYVTTGKKATEEQEFKWIGKMTEPTEGKEMIVITSSEGEKEGNHFVIKGGKSNATWTTTSDSDKDAKFIVLEEKVSGSIDSAGELTEKVEVVVRKLGVADSTDNTSFEVIKLGAAQDDKVHVVRLNETQPLYIIDGEETRENVMSTTAPENIESIEVLKGDKATAAYGEKGKNGVILITTAKAQKKTMSPPPPPAINEIDLKTTAVFIDGKEATEKDLKALSPDDIDHMEVIKGKKAQEKYGKPAAILIKTKQ